MNGRDRKKKYYTVRWNNEIREKKKKTKKKLERNEIPSYIIYKTETKDDKNEKGNDRERGRATDRDSVIYIHTAVIQLKMHTQIQFVAADKKFSHAQNIDRI